MKIEIKISSILQKNKNMKNLTIILLAFSFFAFTSCKDKGDTKLEPPMKMDTAFTATIEFPSIDSLTITATHYHIGNDSPTIILCHQAGWSRGEYNEIAPKLNAMGYNCIAIDQRSGGEINGVTNETKARATTAGKGTNFVDAKQDITATIEWAHEYYNKDMILWGSSYSSALALIIAKENASVSTVLSFSPGEYLASFGVNVGTSMDGLNKPSFLTSSKAEEGQTKLLFDRITASNKVHFVPTGNGEHGSRALWEDKTDHAEYWVAITAFLDSL